MAKAGGRSTGSARSKKASKKKPATRKKAARQSSPKAKAKSRAAEAVAAETSSLKPIQKSEMDQLLPEGKLYYRIGEVAKLTHVKPHVLRYWETEFRWMAPPKSRSKQRLYRRKDIETILLIKNLLYDERYTIAGARQRLRELGLAKALEGKNETHGAATRGQKTASASKAVKAKRGGTQGVNSAAMLELRSGYRRIRSELQALRESL